MRFPQTIDLAPYMSRIHHQLRSKKTRGPDVAASVSRLICMRCHDNVQSDTPQSSPESRTDITIRARTVYTPNVTHVVLNIIQHIIVLFTDSQTDEPIQRDEPTMSAEPKREATFEKA